MKTANMIQTAGRIGQKEFTKIITLSYASLIEQYITQVYRMYFLAKVMIYWSISF